MSDAKMKHVQRQADDVAMVARQNISMALDRGEKLENMEEKAESLESHAATFQKNATKVSFALALRHYCFWRGAHRAFPSQLTARRCTPHYGCTEEWKGHKTATQLRFSKHACVY
jgi:hypothetical protein